MSAQKTDVLQLTLERDIRADRERVFAAWTQPDELRRWSAPEGMTIPEGDLDLRVGGSWRVVMIDPHGGRHEAFGRYLEVTPPERLVYTHAWRAAPGAESVPPETTVTVEFRTIPGGTRVVFTQEGFDTPQSRDGHRTGWSSTLDNLEALFARP